MAVKADLQPLVDLGLTPLEATVYTYLIQHSPATGYRVGKGIGKPTANVYKAIGSLEAKGAVLIEDSHTRLCRAIPAEELLGVLERNFQSVKAAAAAELNKVKSAPDDPRVYHLTSGDQVMERFRHMLGGCKRVAFLDLFPHAVNELRDDIAQTAARGVKVTLKVYEPVEIESVDIHISRDRAKILAKWSGQWVNGVVDGEQHMVAYLSRDGSVVQRALWSNSPLLAMVYYNGFINELTVGAVEDALDHGADIEEIQSIMNHYGQRQSLKAAGYKRSRTGDDLTL